MLCLKPELTQDIVFQCGGEQVVIRPYIAGNGNLKLAISAPKRVEVFRRPATAHEDREQRQRADVRDKVASGKDQD
jgi:sRNA-binding carbon storage regulator CsrA